AFERGRRDRNSIARSYVDALPYPPPLVDNDRLGTYQSLIAWKSGYCRRQTESRSRRRNLLIWIELLAPSVFVGRRARLSLSPNLARVAGARLKRRDASGCSCSVRDLVPVPRN